jgi:hypothetical protein
MKLHQLSVFVENSPGRLRAPCQTLADAGISMATLSLADTKQYGILRLIIRDWPRAKTVLEEAGFSVRVTEVVAVEVPDRPGGLNDVLRVIEQAGINVEYMYAFAEKRDGRAVLIFRFEDADAAVAALQSSDISMSDAIELF